MTQLDRRTLLKLLAAGAGSMMSGTALPSRAAPHIDSRLPADLTFSEKLADYVVRARFTDLPPAAIDAAREQVALFVGCASTCAPLPGNQARLPVAEAAYANAMSLLDDDTAACLDVHPASAFTLPAALALGEARRVPVQELVLSIVLSHEVLAKLSRPTWRWTGALPCEPCNIFGGLGPMIVAGRLLELDHERMTHAVSAGAHLSLSTAQGSMIHHYYGRIARSGMQIAQLVETGAIRYSRSVVDGEHGLYRSLLEGEPDQLARAIDNLAYAEIVAATRRAAPH